MARSKDGSELYFRADDALPRGATASLQPVTSRSLVFKGAEA